MGEARKSWGLSDSSAELTLEEGLACVHLRLLHVSGDVPTRLLENVDVIHQKSLSFVKTQTFRGTFLLHSARLW